MHCETWRGRELNILAGNKIGEGLIAELGILAFGIAEEYKRKETEIH